ncbi:BrnT family toxin [Rhodopila sp.]|uniref:BrnT family toxin n=1 Tax=Rhodopila sp. TaxID=2480087 RepID=UPI003D09BDE6
MRFTWDEAKAGSNQAKHQVGFETAVRVFLDPFALSEQDRIEEGEYRWQIIGSIEGEVFLVAHMEREAADGATIIRIISARRAVRTERRRYEEEKYRRLRT